MKTSATGFVLLLAAVFAAAPAQAQDKRQLWRFGDGTIRRESDEPPAAIPEEFRGRWTLKYYVAPGEDATSGDGKQIFTVSASEVKIKNPPDFLDDNKWNVERIIPGKAPPGKKAVVIRFTNGKVWLLGQEEKKEKDIYIWTVKPDGKPEFNLSLSPAD